MSKPAVQLTLTVTSGWASTNPGTTRYHYYDAEGKCLCAYQKGEGALHPYAGTPEIPTDACTSCALHVQKGHHLPIARVGPAVVLPPDTRIRVTKGKLAGAFGYIQRYDAQAKMYFVAFGKQFEPFPPSHIEAAPL